MYPYVNPFRISRINNSMAQMNVTPNKGKNVARKWYTDLDINLTAHPQSGDLVLKQDKEAIKRSLRNILLTNHYERPFHPEIGSDIRGLLFENMTPLTALNLERKVIEVLTNFEPRAKIVNVIAQPQEDANRYHIQISFYVVGISTPVVVETYLTRLR